jgi:hypothetical protein
VAPTAEVDAGDRVLSVVGILGFAVPAVGSVLFAATWDFPGTEASGAEVLAYVGEHRSGLRVGVLLDALGVVLWGLFGLGVWRRLGDRGPVGGFMAAGFAWMVPLLLAGFTAFLVLAYRAPRLTPQDAALLYDLTFALLAISGLPTAVALGAYAHIVWRTGGLPVWTALLAALGAAAHVLLLASFFVSDGFLSLQGQIITAAPATLFIWVLGTAIALRRSQTEDSPAF